MVFSVLIFVSLGYFNAYQKRFLMKDLMLLLQMSMMNQLQKPTSTTIKIQRWLIFASHFPHV